MAGALITQNVCTSAITADLPTPTRLVNQYFSEILFLNSFRGIFLVQHEHRWVECGIRAFFFYFRLFLHILSAGISPTLVWEHWARLNASAPLIVVDSPSRISPFIVRPGGMNEKLLSILQGKSASFGLCGYLYL